MNAIDILFILLVLGSLALGFFQGTIKLVVAIAAFYVSIVLAGLYFESLGILFMQKFQTPVEAGKITGFATILLLGFLVLLIAGLYTFRYVRFPTSLDFADRIIGTMFGLLLGALVLGMLALLLRRLFMGNIADQLTWPFMAVLQRSVRSSILVNFFATQILPMIYASLRPILPRGADYIFLIR